MDLFPQINILSETNFHLNNLKKSASLMTGLNFGRRFDATGVQYEIGTPRFKHYFAICS